jgi:hypothetical protein
MKNQLGRRVGGLANTLGSMHSFLQPNPGASRLARFVGSGLVLLLLGTIIIPNASGQIFGLTNGNSIVGVSASTPAGMFNYAVDGVNQVNNQWFYYRAGSMTSEASIDSIGTLTAVQSDARDLSLTYSAAGYSARVVYSLVGGSSGSGQSGLNETITFINNSATSDLTLSFFDYSNFQLGGTPTGQTLQFGTSVIPPPVHYNSFTQTAGSLSLTSKLISITSPTHIEAALYNQTLASLTDNAPTTLDDNPGPVSGDVTGTFEWDVDLAPDASLTISQLVDITPIPEPSSALLLALGLGVGATVLGLGASLGRRVKRNLLDSDSNSNQ